MKTKLQLALAAMMAAGVVTQCIASEDKVTKDMACYLHQDFADTFDVLNFQVKFPSNVLLDLNKNASAVTYFSDSDTGKIVLDLDNSYADSARYGVTKPEMEVSWNNGYAIVPNQFVESTYTSNTGNPWQIGSLIDLVSEKFTPANSFESGLVNLPGFTAQGVAEKFENYSLYAEPMTNSSGKYITASGAGHNTDVDNAVVYYTAEAIQRSDYKNGKEMGGRSSLNVSLKFYIAKDKNGNEVTATQNDLSATPAEMKLIGICSTRYTN